ncbi:MAG: S8 family serine peptidase [Bryobacteraceae bacterium]
MRPAWILLLFTSVLAGGTVPDRYIVELAGAPVAQEIARTIPPEQRHTALLGETGQRFRSGIRQRQILLRDQLRRRGAVVIGSVDTVANAVFVRVPAARAARLRQTPGVKRVMPVRTFNLMLDHALPLHKIPEAWNLGGAYPQGAGVKIALIDTGIDVTHPGFKDTGFQAPSGFPKTNAASDVAFTNQKVIVARSYASLFTAKDPDSSARDRVGHGTATGMTAAGVQNAGPLATITGAAPLAFLGSYKVFGTPGVNDSASEDAIIKAVDDAVADGMDVINLSLGAVPAPRTGDDPEVQALENASVAGVLVVVSAGNTGPDPNTISSPGTSPSAISVGASNNDRQFAAAITVNGKGPYLAFPGTGSPKSGSITGNLVDIALSLDPTGLGCGTLPLNSLKGNIALILRGTCFFENKLDNAQAAGAVGALVYTDQARPDAIVMDTGAATLPAEMVSYQDGLTIKQMAKSDVQATLPFTLSPFPLASTNIASFSAHGPNVDLGIKPELLAVGENLYTAAQNFDKNGELYDATRYVVTEGTSFSAPLVAGAAATLMAARPGFTALQYRSLLINSAAVAFAPPGQSQRVQDAGAGLLDLSAAVRSTLAVEPASISLGVGPGSAKLSGTLRLSNISYTGEKFLVSVVPMGNAPLLVPASTSIQLDANTYFDLGLSFTVAGLTAGEYEGFVVIEGTNSGIQTRVPYWYGVASSTAAHITVLYAPPTPPKAGSTVPDAIMFRITDTSGIDITSVRPSVTVSSGGGSVLSINSQDVFYPGVWSVDVRIGPSSGGTNTYHIVAGSIAQDVTITAQ